MNVEQLIKIMPYAAKHATATFVDQLNATMKEFEINTVLRQAAFIAQIGHESGQFQYVKEIAPGTAYEGRKDLGNTSAGDGVKYKGRGYIQITGKANYFAVQTDLGIPCIEHPELLETTENAFKVSGWFWNKHSLNALADAKNFIAITKKINGGTNGEADREQLYNKALLVIAAQWEQ